MDNNINVAVQELAEVMKECAIETLEEGATEAVAEIQALTPVKRGNLRRSITHSEVNKNNLSVKVGSALKYAQPVEEGHAQEVGKYIPAIGKKLKKAYVPGKHMMRDGLTITESRLEGKLQRKLEERLGRL